MAQNTKKILVTGATGSQGGSLIQFLLKKGYELRAFTRKESPATRNLRSLGVEIAMGNFDDPASITKAAQGMDVVFAMSTPYEKGPDAETEEGLNLVNAVKKAGVGHLVFTSVAGAHQHTGIPHFDSKMKIEEVLPSLGLPYTIVAPVFFMENLIGPWWRAGLEEGKLAMALSPNRKLQQIAVADIGRFDAYVIEHLDQFAGKRIEIASDELSGSQAVEIISRASGRKIKYAQLPLDQLYAQNPDFGRMFEWFEQIGYSANIPQLREQYPDIGWHTFAEWAKEVNWNVLREPAARR